MTSNFEKIVMYYNLDDDITNNIQDLLHGSIKQNKIKHKEIMNFINEYNNIRIFAQRILIELYDFKQLKHVYIQNKKINNIEGQNQILIHIKWKKEFAGPTSIMINDYGYLHIETYEYTKITDGDDFIAEFVDLIIYSSIDQFIEDMKYNN